MGELADKLEAMPIAELEAGPEGCPVNIFTVCFDDSESMRKYPERVRLLNRLMRDCDRAAKKESGFLLAVGFDEKASIFIPLVPAGQTPRLICQARQGKTLYYETLRDVLAYLLRLQDRLASAKRPIRITLCVITDGVDNLSSLNAEAECLEMSAVARERGWKLLTYGLGVEASEVAMRIGFPRDRNSTKTFFSQV